MNVPSPPILAYGYLPIPTMPLGDVGCGPVRMLTSIRPWEMIIARVPGSGGPMPPLLVHSTRCWPSQRFSELALEAVQNVTT